MAITTIEEAYTCLQNISHQWMRRRETFGWAREEILQMAIISVLVKHRESGKIPNLKRYFKYAVKNFFSRKFHVVYKATAFKKEYVEWGSIDDVCIDDESSIPSDDSSLELESSIDKQSVVKRISERYGENHAIAMSGLLDGATESEIGNELGITRQRVRQLQDAGCLFLTKKNLAQLKSDYTETNNSVFDTVIRHLEKAKNNTSTMAKLQRNTMLRKYSVDSVKKILRSMQNEGVIEITEKTIIVVEEVTSMEISLVRQMVLKKTA